MGSYSFFFNGEQYLGILGFKNIEHFLLNNKILSFKFCHEDKIFKNTKSYGAFSIDEIVADVQNEKNKGKKHDATVTITFGRDAGMLTDISKQILLDNLKNVFPPCEVDWR